jgi:hypothetical protein
MDGSVEVVYKGRSLTYQKQFQRSGGPAVVDEKGINSWIDQFVTASAI